MSNRLLLNRGHPLVSKCCFFIVSGCDQKEISRERVISVIANLIYSLKRMEIVIHNGNTALEAFKCLERRRFSQASIAGVFSLDCQATQYRPLRVVEFAMINSYAVSNMFMKDERGAEVI